MFHKSWSYYRGGIEKQMAPLSHPKAVFAFVVHLELFSKHFLDDLRSLANMEA
jgi:hypothetical protein